METKNLRMQIQIDLCQLGCKDLVEIVAKTVVCRNDDVK